MPTILLLGPRCSGKRSIADYLVQQEGFERVSLSTAASLHASTSRSPSRDDDNTLVFHTPSDFLDYATLNWRKRYVCADVRDRKELDAFIKRPWVLLVGCEAALAWRWKRANERLRLAQAREITLEEFVEADDLDTFGQDSYDASAGAQHALKGKSSVQTLQIPNGNTASPFTLPTHPPPSPDLQSRTLKFANGQTEKLQCDPLAPLLRLCNLHVRTSTFASLEDLSSYLRILDLTKEDRMRPGWDRYFMTLAGLASLRSNCMKRRVGAVLVSNKRVISTGYNGTPRGMRNCNEGGCARCNSTSVSSMAGANGTVTPIKSGVALDECLCLHAEENALLEAGRDRAEGGSMYCNTCPCLRCAVKITQMNIKEIVYSQSYSMDEASARVFKEAGVSMRQIELSE